jgi:Tfp pilus assembly protein PilP
MSIVSSSQPTDKAIRSPLNEYAIYTFEVRGSITHNADVQPSPNSFIVGVSNLRVMLATHAFKDFDFFYIDEILTIMTSKSPKEANLIEIVVKENRKYSLELLYGKLPLFIQICATQYTYITSKDPEMVRLRSLFSNEEYEEEGSEEEVGNRNEQ